MSTPSIEASMEAETLSALPLPVWRRDASLKIIFCNGAFAKAAEVEAHAVLHGGQVELYKQAAELARRALESGKRASERRHIVIQGERRLYEIMETPLAGGTAGVAVDVTETEKQETELKRYAAAQSDFLESSASAMAVFSPDTRLKSCNQAFMRLWKLEESWLENKPTYGELLEYLREKRRLPEQANFPVFKKEQVALFTSLIETHQDFFYLPDGAVLRVLIIPHALGGLLFAFEDITSRLDLERSYNTLIAVQRATLDNLHEGVAVFGEDGKLKLSNPVFAALWGVDADFLSGAPHASEVAERMARVFGEGEEWEVFRRNFIARISMREADSQNLERADGKVVEWRATPLPDGATLMTFIDVTAASLVERSLRERAEALEEADKLKSEFLANVSYELRSPLTTIMGFSEVLLQKYFGDLNSQQQEYIEGIYKSSGALMTLINDILDLASIEAGYLKLEAKEFDIYEALSAVKFLATERAKEAGIKLRLACAPEIGRMLGDETRIKQVMFSLLSNAIKFTPRDGLVSLGAETAGEDRVALWVEDNGIGIPHEAIGKIFNKFFKAGSSKAHKAGTGLGLSIVKSFVELHGGSIDIQSEEGKGTRVRCLLERRPRALAGEG